MPTLTQAGHSFGRMIEQGPDRGRPSGSEVLETHILAMILALDLVGFSFSIFWHKSGETLFDGVQVGKSARGHIPAG